MTTLGELLSEECAHPEHQAAETIARLEAANRRLRALAQFGREIRAELDLKALLALIPHYLAETTGCAGAAIVVYDRNLGTVGRVGAFGMAPSFVHRWQEALHAGDAAEGTELSVVKKARGPVVFGDIAADSRLAAVRDPILAAGMRSSVAMPLIVRGELLGALVAYYRLPWMTSQEEVEYLGALADEGAAAIHNAWLYAQTRRELRRRDALRKVVAFISSELDLASLLERVAASTVELLDATGGSISLVDESGGARVRAVHNLPADLVGTLLGPGQGLTGEVLLARAPVIVAEYAHDLRRPLPKLEDVHACIAVPIWWQRRLIGVFTVFDSDPSRTFDEQDREAMELLANHIAIAIENARLYGEARERLVEVTGLQAKLQGHLEQMVGLQRLSTLVLEERDFDRVLQAICQQLLRLTDATGVGLALLNELGRFLELRTMVGPSAEVLRGARMPLDGSFAGEALRTNQPLRSDDAQNDPRGYTPGVLLGKSHTILTVPMKTRQRAVGVISIYDKHGDGGFTDRDAELATLFANHAAVAIENARLYDQIREYAVVEERNRLARELHDSVTQSLFSVTLLCQASLSLWDRQPAKARERLERANDLAKGALAEMRALIFQLRPMALQEEGLLSALKKHLAALRSREGLDVALHVDGAERRLPAPLEEAAFRIVQESLNNVVKHARVKWANVQLAFDEARLRICTEDQGAGFNPTGRPKLRTLGMASMRERAEEVGGSLRVDSAPNRGTRVHLELPVPSQEDHGKQDDACLGLSPSSSAHTSIG